MIVTDKNKAAKFLETYYSEKLINKKINEIKGQLRKEFGYTESDNLRELAIAKFLEDSGISLYKTSTGSVSGKFEKVNPITSTNPQN
jgi:hypothetical protein